MTAAHNVMSAEMRWAPRQRAGLEPSAAYMFPSGRAGPRAMAHTIEEGRQQWLVAPTTGPYP